MHMRRIEAIDLLETEPERGLLISRLLALQVIRRALIEVGAEGVGWRAVGDAFRQAQAQMLRQQKVGLVIGAEGAARTTRHERRLLRATAASQVPDSELVDNYLFSLAPGRGLRPFVTEAVERLAAGLARHGHRLPLAGAGAMP